MTRTQIICGALVLVVAYLLYTQVEGGPDGFGRPQKQASGDADVDPWVNTPDGRHHLCRPHEHHSGYVYTPHRYPRVTGGEISAVIHRGFSPMRVPAATPDADWIVSPPSEAQW
jgi:hypothetical protein